MAEMPHEFMVSIAKRAAGLATEADQLADHVRSMPVADRESLPEQLDKLERELEAISVIACEALLRHPSYARADNAREHVRDLAKYVEKLRHELQAKS